jgi:UPF0271 protein
MTFVDLNCDLGEGQGDDAAILAHVTSASVACGLHAGGPAVMRRTVEAARRAGAAVGAHPSFPDREGFGRREMDLPPDELRDLVLYQLGALEVFVRAAGMRLQHVKAHGALYHVANRQPEAGEALAAATRQVRADLILVGAPGSALEAAAARQGLRFAGEVFADRQYGEDGLLLPRSDPRALVEGDDAAVAARALAMVEQQTVWTAGGRALARRGHTLCLHGDDPRAAGRAAAIRAAFARAGVNVAPLGSWL